MTFIFLLCSLVNVFSNVTVHLPRTFTGALVSEIGLNFEVHFSKIDMEDFGFFDHIGLNRHVSPKKAETYNKFLYPLSLQQTG